MNIAAIPVGQRDYSLVGADGRRAIEIGLASAEWYHSEVPRAVIKDLEGHKVELTEGQPLARIFHTRKGFLFFSGKSHGKGGVTV